MTARAPFDWSARKPITLLSPQLQAPARAIEHLTRELDQTQWLSRVELERIQFAQLTAIARHFVQASPSFRARLTDAGLRADDLGSPEGLRRLAPLRRRDLRDGLAIADADVPVAHRPTESMASSGSTGEPVVVRKTAVNALFWYALTMREMFWHQAPFNRRFSAIRATTPEQRVLPDWGQPVGLFFETGEAQVLPISSDAAQLLTWLTAFQPHILLVYPGVLSALETAARARGTPLSSLMLIQTVGEMLPADVRALAMKTFGCKVIDNYSAQEVGIVAQQCPDSDLYHVTDEAVLVEVLDDAGNPCPPGVAGRAVITDLHNLATPIIRYEIGDYVEYAEPCPCGRGLTTLRRIAGRERNLVTLPDGTKHWPLVGFAQFRDAAPVLQYQIVQETLERLEMRLVVERPLSASEEDALREIVRSAIGYRFEIRFAYYSDALPRPANGKFEEFVSRIQS